MRKLPNIFQYIVVLCGLTMTTGCVSEFDPIQNQGDGGTGGLAQQLFEDNVAEMVIATCGDPGACHTGTSPLFVTGTMYQDVVKFKGSLFPNYAADDPIIDYAEPNVHQGGDVPPYEDIQLIQDWLDEEKKQAGL